MEKTHPSLESAPPYPGPPLDYSGPGAYPSPGYPGPQPGYPGPQPGYPGPQPGYFGPQPGYPGPQPGYPGPQPGYQGGGLSPGQHTTVVTHVVSPAVQAVSCQAICIHCQQTVITRTRAQSGLLTWAVCGGLALLGCFLCCCIPFCVDSCQDVEHICPNCNKVIAVYKRM